MANDHIFLGVDLAGDTGLTGAAYVWEEQDRLACRVESGSFQRQDGLLDLAALIGRAQLAAIDQPFAYSESMMRLLGGSALLESLANRCASDLSWRRTDIRMREILKSYGLSVHGVMSPNRCQNIWRALLLAAMCGISREEVCRCTGKIVETHPRVALARLMPIGIRDQVLNAYKSKDPDGALEARSAALEEMRRILRLEFATSDDVALAIESDDRFEAVVAAVVAFLHGQGATEICGYQNATEPNLAIEGAAVVPDDQAIASLKMTS